MMESHQRNTENSKGGDSSFSKLNQERASQSNAIEIPQISLPKGGGALKGIDEKFQVNSANGTSSFSIPLPLSPNRNGFTPSLSISYNSGAGNSLLGIGWGLDIPSITRRTDKKLPRYFDLSNAEDVFMFSGVEDLVPKLEWICDAWQKVEKTEKGYLIQEYRPRIEGAFSRIERICSEKKGIYWRVTTRDNITTIFGSNPHYRIADPNDERKIFEWLPEVSFDDKGSAVLFEYKREDLVNVPNITHEKNRHNGLSKFTNLYLKRVKYGNTKPIYPNDSIYDPSLPSDIAWHFEVVLDYGEHNDKQPSPREVQAWGTRPDPFSFCRSGFEVRTYRLLKRVLMFHHFAELNHGESTLVRSLDFKHTISDSANSDRETELEFLQSITQSGYVWNTQKGEYNSKSLPPLVFDYEPLKWNHRVREVKQDDLVHAPTGLSGNYQWVDLYNEGISGILTEQGAGWFYKRNDGDIDEDGQVSFENARLVLSKPSFMGLQNGVLQVQDLQANGEKQIVINAQGIQGYFELEENAENWKPFRAFLTTANVDLRDPNVRIFDINGDGKAEIVLSDQGAFWWWASKGKEGYDSPELTRQPFDEERGPAIVFSDSEQRIFLADMTGDGLTDIVRIRNGEICYWSNLGYGHFGAKVTMTNSPWFDEPDLFNPQYLELADISGTGAADLLYLGKNKFKAYLNLSGNRWGSAEIIEPFFPTEQPNRITVTDLLGNGTSCLVWSSELPAYSHSPMRYMDLMGGKKPHIMTHYRNNMGKEVTMHYKSSTWFYLKDKKEGTPWISRLPFPVQCVRKTVIEENITGLRFASEYSYHHGYYDHVEREFRGFGRVEQVDTETFGQLNSQSSANAQVETLHQPPILTKTWFHTGLFLDQRDRILTQFEKEYWYNSSQLAILGIQPIETPLPEAQVVEAESVPARVLDNLSPEEWREALRACKGMLLRQEVFALDAPKEKASIQQLRLQATPYTVATHNCEVQVLQPRYKNPYAVFIVKESEAITYQYERHHEDPRIAHTLNIEVDKYGNILESASIVYGRLQRPKEAILQTKGASHGQLLDCIEKAVQAQRQIHVLYTKNDYTKDNQQLIESYRLPVLCQTRTYELNGFEKELLPDCDSGIDLYKIKDFKGVLNKKEVVERLYQELAPSQYKKTKRLIEHVKTLFLDDSDLKKPLPFGEQGTRGLVYENYQLAYTPSLRDAIYTSDPVADNTAAVQVTDADMLEGRYVSLEGNWWIRSGLPHFIFGDETVQTAFNRFFLPIAYTDPFDSVTKVVYDRHFFFVQEAIDPIGNTATVEKFNYRTLSPTLLKDANDDKSIVFQDELGLVKASAILGKGDEADDLEGFTEWETAEDKRLLNAFWQEVSQIETDSVALQQLGRDLLKHATTRFVYDFDRYYLSDGNPQFPSVVAGISREEHHTVLVKRGQVENQRLQMDFEYSDGSGKVAMKKAQFEGGKAKRLTQNQTVETVATGIKMRWVGNGRTVYNNKGNPILQYEPYFSTSAGYESAPILVENGVFVQLTYDPIGRAIRTDFPDNTFNKIEFDAWSQTSFDQNDTVLETAWYSDRQAETGTDAVAKGIKQSAKSVENHANTPSRLFLDSLGRPVLAVEHLKDQFGSNEYHYTRVELDIEGNARAIYDARFNRVMAYDYDMLGHRVYQDSMDAGKRWMFNNAIGSPVKLWDQRRHLFTYSYDVLHRPTESRVVGGDGEQALDRVYEKIIYGENLPDDKAKRLRGKTAFHYDTTGRMAAEGYDFKGNPLSNTRRLTKAYQQTPDWGAPDTEDLLQEESFTSSAVFDALNRPVQQIAPHSDLLPARKYNIVQITYNDAGLLECTHAWLQQDSAPQELLDPTTSSIQPVGNIDYNEKAQRTLIQYGNGITIRYKYDAETFRLTNLRTTKRGGELLQDLNYTYDPVGNIVQIWDKAIPTVFYANHRIEPVSSYQYDSLYRLTQATGREHIGQQDAGKYDNWSDSWSQVRIHSNDAIALREYTQSYRYDAVGNILQMRHQVGAHGSWTRDYTYKDLNNRLRQTSVGGNTYSYPHHKQHGFITQMPHLQIMQWNFREELQQTIRTAGDNAPETWYNYDGSGQRSRKINTTAQGRIEDERIYLGGFEIYRKSSDTAEKIERETLHIMDGEKRILMVDMRTAGTDDYDTLTQRYQLGNHLGSVALEIDDKGEVISYEEYHPYGTTAYQATNESIKAVAKRYRYTGMERDDETGLEYHSARYYLPWLGRWLSADPIGVEGGLNLYEYSISNPLIFIDGQGNDPTPFLEGNITFNGNPNDPSNYSDFESFQEGVTVLSEEGARQEWSEYIDENELPVVENYEEYTETYIENEEYQLEVKEAGGGSVAAGTLALSGAMVADDVTVIGIADDPLIPVVFVGGMLIAGALAITTSTTRTETRVRPITKTREATRRMPLIYVTYTKTNPKTNQVYTGRTRGYGTPQQIIAARDFSHHMSALGFGPAKPDVTLPANLPLIARWLDPSYQAIRGREQQLIDYYGKAKSEGGSSGNAIRGVAKDNELGKLYHAMASGFFGEVYSYTGY